MIDLANYGNKNFNNTSLSSIIFGARANQCEIEEIKELCTQNGLNYVKI